MIWKYLTDMTNDMLSMIRTWKFCKVGWIPGPDLLVLESCANVMLCLLSELTAHCSVRLPKWVVKVGDLQTRISQLIRSKSPPEGSSTWGRVYKSNWGLSKEKEQENWLDFPPKKEGCSPLRQLRTQWEPRQPCPNSGFLRHRQVIIIITMMMMMIYI